MQTIGSPRTLKLVLTSTGTACQAFESLEKSAKTRISVFVDCLEPARIVDVGHSGDLRADDVDPAPQIRIMLHGLQCVGINRDAAVLEHRGHQEHVRALLARFQIEPLGRSILQNSRRKWAETLAKFDLEIHRGLHGRRAGVAKNAPRAEGSGAEFHPALEPANHLTIGEKSGGMVNQIGSLRQIADRRRLAWIRTEQPDRL